MAHIIASFFLLVKLYFFQILLKNLQNWKGVTAMDFLKKPVTTKVVQPPLSAETVAEWRK